MRQLSPHLLILRREVDREVGYYADKEDAYYMKKDLQAKLHPTPLFPRKRRIFRNSFLLQPLQYKFEDL